MRILQLMAGAAEGGAETAFADMSIALREAGHAVEVVTRPHNPHRIARLQAADIAVHTARFGGVLDLLTAGRIRRAVETFRPDIVQSWMERAARFAPAWTPQSGVPRYASVARLGGYYAMKYFKSAGYFVTITPAIREYLIAQGVASDRVRHINNFAETETDFMPVDRVTLGVPLGATLLLALGRLHTSKAFDTLISAVAGLPGFYLWIAGEGPERNALQRQIDQSGAVDRIRLLGWRNDRAALLAACDICVFPSRYEPFGTVFVQAWAARRPLVSSTADGPRQFVRDGEDGVMFPVDDVAALQNALQRVQRDRALAAALTERGWQRYQSEFTKEKTVAGYVSFYEEVRATL